MAHNGNPNSWMKQVKCESCRETFMASVRNMYLDVVGPNEVVKATCSNCGDDTMITSVPKVVMDYLHGVI